MELPSTPPPRSVCETCPEPAVLTASPMPESYDGSEPLKLCLRCLGSMLDVQKDRELGWCVRSLTRKKPYKKPEIRELSPDDPRVREMLDELESRK